MIHLDDSTPVLDVAVINQLRSIDPQETQSLLRRLVDLYISSAPAVVNEILQDVAKADISHLKHVVHRFKTTNANLGLRRMQQILIQMEAPNLDVSVQKNLANQLSTELQKALSALHEI